MKKLILSAIVLIIFATQAFSQCDLEVKKYSSFRESCYSVPGYLFVVGNEDFKSNEDFYQYVLAEVEGAELCIEWGGSELSKNFCIKFPLDRVAEAYDILMNDEKIFAVRNLFSIIDVSKENVDMADNETFIYNALCYGNKFEIELIPDVGHVGDWPSIQNREDHKEIDTIMSQLKLTEEFEGFFYRYHCQKDTDLFDVCKEITESKWFNGASPKNYNPGGKIVFYESPTSVKSATAEPGIRVTYYNLQGQPVLTPASKGIFISEGKKILVE